MPSKHSISAETSTKIGNALAPAFRAVKPVVDSIRQTRALLQPINPETSDAIKAKSSMIDQYKQGVAGEKGKVQGSFKKGGKVKKTGIYRLHKNERVLTTKQTKRCLTGDQRH